MGLALHNPSDSLPDLGESRYLGPGREPLSPTTKARRARISRAKYLNWCLRQDVYAPSETQGVRLPLRPDQLAILKANYRTIPRNICARPARRARPAAPDLQLQSESWSPAPRRRTPSLERQDAFADAKTAKKGHQRWLDQDQLEPEVVEAYRLDLLYDDEHVRGSGFGLDAIVHDEPVYTIRASGRRRKGRTAAGYAASETYEKIDLPLDLSLAALGDDAALARYLADAEMSEDQGEEMLIQRAYDVPSITRVIYELVSASNNHSTEMDNCEKMDEDTNAEDNTPGVSEFPDLISDDENEDGDNDWAVVPDGGSLDDDNDLNMDLAPAGGGGGGGGNAAGGDNNLDAWIVLG